MDNTYLERREKKNYTTYRLSKRKEMVIDSLKNLLNNNVNYILDIGTSDGKMLSDVAGHFDIKKAIGIDTSREAINIANKQRNINALLANLLNLPFKDGVFDILFACAVLEHIGDVDEAIKGSHRVLRNGGFFFVTLPNPFYDWLNSKLIKTYHVKRYWIREIRHTLENYGFEIIKADYFMVWPFGKVLFDRYIEQFLRFLKLDFLLFNHITVGKKISNKP